MTFLESVAKDIYNKYGENLSEVIVVFPNKRASLFLNKYLHKLIGHSFWSPKYITICQLFRQQSNRIVADQIKTICILHRAFCQCTGSSESLDQFWGWGQLMLADFDDLDKNMGNAEQVYANVSDHHALDTYDYLDEHQRDILKKLFSSFNGEDDSVLKQRFMMFWNKLYDVYTTFNKMLADEGLAYEGALYREVAQKADELEWEGKKYLFVGFNMIQKCEQALFQSFKDAGKGLFYWDFDKYYIGSKKQEAGKFINDYLGKFPNELNDNDEELYDNFSKQKDLTYYSTQTENIQARYIADWLKENGRLEAMERTAIVLSDESLLKSIIHYLPAELSGKVNITIGYPLSQTPIVALVKNFINLHVFGYNGVNFNGAMTNLVLRHPYARHISPLVEDLINTIEEEHVLYPKPQDLCVDEGMELLFTPFEGEGCQNTQERNAAMMQRLLKILKHIGISHEKERMENLVEAGIAPEEAPVTYEDQFLQESVFKMHNVITRMSDLIREGLLVINQHTLIRLIDQIVQSTTMPFHGEPAVGIQVMGVLETRNLDFDHVLLLSCNEGNLPKGINDSSLIPHSIRKAFGLTTIENKVAIYAYYFYRLLQRATDVGITYNSSTEGGNTGQMSRFMLQLMVEAQDCCILKQRNLIAEQKPHELEVQPIIKDQHVMEMLLNMRSISPSAIVSYLRCPLLFYYQVVNGLSEPNSDDTFDNRTFGNIFHYAARKLYEEIQTDKGLITKQAIGNLLDEKDGITIKRYVDEGFRQALSQKETIKKLDGLQQINHNVICQLIRNLLSADKALAPFNIVGLERGVYENITIDISGHGEKTLRLGGSIDRLDCVDDGKGGRVLRVVDYKTGRTLPQVPSTVEEIFSPAGIEKHYNYYLQAMLYSVLVRHNSTAREFRKNTFRSHAELPDGEMTTIYPLNPKQLAVQPALLYIQKSESISEPVLNFNVEVGFNDKGKPITEKRKIEDIVTYEPEFREELKKLVTEIFNQAIPFEQTCALHRCVNCTYKNICRR